VSTRHWIEREIGAAAATGQEVVVFMHTYPADLTAGRSQLNDLLTEEHVLCVDMGHSYYNKLANDAAPSSWRRARRARSKKDPWVFR
jgi:hypothetical protein